MFFKDEQKNTDKPILVNGFGYIEKNDLLLFKDKIDYTFPVREEISVLRVASLYNEDGQQDVRLSGGIKVDPDGLISLSGLVHPGSFYCVYEVAKVPYTVYEKSEETHHVNGVTEINKRVKEKLEDRYVLFDSLGGTVAVFSESETAVEFLKKLESSYDTTSYFSLDAWRVKNILFDAANKFFQEEKETATRRESTLRD